MCELYMCVFVSISNTSVTPDVGRRNLDKTIHQGATHFSKKNQLDETASIIQHCTRPLNKSLAAAGHRWDKLSLGRVSLHGL